MTSMYKCDKCGKMFADYDECYNHEYKHWNLSRWDDFDGKMDSMTEYKEGQEEPNVVHLVFTRWNSDTCQTEKRCGKYKLISSYDAPLIIENE